MAVTPREGTRLGHEFDEVIDAFRRAERRLRDTLLGDGVYASGAVRGAEARDSVGKDLRQLRTSFDAAAQLVDDAERERLDAALKREAQLAARRAARRAKKPSS